MVEVRFYDRVDDHLLQFAVIVAQTRGKWVFCKHRERDTYEVPGGHREQGEDILAAAKRELREETGAVAVELENQAGTRRPADSRGIGVPTIRALLERNGGRMEITQQGNEYRTAVWLPKAAGASE